MSAQSAESHPHSIAFAADIPPKPTATSESLATRISNGFDDPSIKIEHQEKVVVSRLQDVSMALITPTSSTSASVRNLSPIDTSLSSDDKFCSSTVEDLQSNLLTQFIADYKELEKYIAGELVNVSGSSLSISAITAVARYGARVALDNSSGTHTRVKASRQLVDDKLAANKSIYGVSTGFGGSADTRTENYLGLGLALLQHQPSGILPVPSQNSFMHDSRPAHDPVTKRSVPLPMSPLLASLSMPIPWVRAAILIRANSLIRGHSAVRFELIQRLADLLTFNITPLVPLRGSISASGDLSPLSYVANTLMGNPTMRVHVMQSFATSVAGQEPELVNAPEALAKHGLRPLTLLPKEHLGILNGTAFSAGLAALVLTDAAHLALLAQSCTAFGVETLLGSDGSFASFVHDVCRPHAGQVEVAANVRKLLEGSKLVVHEDDGEEKTIDEDKGRLRQDRYPLRTSPQFIGPQVEDILRALKVVKVECNSTTDNPLIDVTTGTIHHGGNFQAMSITNAMESVRLSLHHLGKILFAQTTELINPAMNRGLPPNLAFTDPSLNFAAKGIDIGCAAYVAELGWLANPVSTHVQSAEMHNQAVNSMAFVSARATEKAIEVCYMIVASYLWALCQAADIRALLSEMRREAKVTLRELLRKYMLDGSSTSGTELRKLERACWDALDETIENTSSMDAKPRMEKCAQATIVPITMYFSHPSSASSSPTRLAALPTFLAALSARLHMILTTLQRAYLAGSRGRAPASYLLGKTRALYEFVRVELGIMTHGRENLELFGKLGAAKGTVTEWALGHNEDSIGGAVSTIYNAVRDGRMQTVVVGIFDTKASQSMESGRAE